MRLCCFVAVSLFLAATPVFAAEDPLDALPAETGVVLRLSPPSEIAGKAKTFLNKAAPRYAQIADSLAPGLGSLVGNFTLAGIDAQRDWYVAVLPRAEKRPAVVFAIPAADAAAMKESVGEGFTFAEHEDWLLYSLDAEAIGRLPPAEDRTKQSIRKAIVEPLRSVFSEGEVAVFLNIPALREAYRPQIDRAKEQFIKAAAKPSAGAQNTQALQLGLEYNRKLLETLLETIDDTTGVVENVSIGETALETEALIAVAADSDAARFLAKQKPTDFPLLAKLPRGRPAYYGLAGDFSDLIAASMRMSAELYQDDEELRKQFDELGKLRIDEAAGSFELGDLEGGVYRGISLLTIDKPEQYLRLARDMAEAMKDVKSAGIQQKITIEPQSETIREVEVDVLKMEVTPDPKTDPTGSSRKFLEILFGKEGMTQRLAVVEGTFVQAIGDEKVMQAAIGAVRGEASSDEPAQTAVRATRTKLGETANVLVIFDVPRLAGGAVQIAIETQQLPLPIEGDAIESLNLSPSYAGFMAAAGTDVIRLRGVLPAEQVRGIVELFSVLQKAAPQRPRPAN